MAAGRIFDTFTFDGELSLLAHRFAETADLVDFYVIVEAGETFQGNAKPLVFSENRARFAAYDSKIRLVTLPRLGTPGTDPWQRERTQRDATLFALGDTDPDDIVLILDADEIPSRSLLRRLRTERLDAPRRLLMTRHYQAVDLLGPRSPCCPEPDVAFAFAHHHLKAGRWDMLNIDWFSRGGVAVPYRLLVAGPDRVRLSPFELRRSVPVAGGYPDAGRHLCFVDPSAQPLRKLARTAHTELASARGDPQAYLALCQLYSVHHRGWWYAERPEGPLPEDLARLIDRHPTLHCRVDVSMTVERRAFRTWAWLRTCKAIPNRLVRAIDRRWDLLSVALTPLLLAADAIRALAASAPPKIFKGKRVPSRHFGA